MQTGSATFVSRASTRRPNFVSDPRRMTDVALLDLRWMRAAVASRFGLAESRAPVLLDRDRCVVRTYRRRSPVTERSAGFGISGRLLQVDAELAQLDDRRSAPADRVGRERQRERHPVRFAERLALAQDAVVPGRRLDGEAERLEAADELANVLPHLGPGRPGPGSACQLRVRSPVVKTAGTALRTPKGPSIPW